METGRANSAPVEDTATEAAAIAADINHADTPEQRAGIIDVLREHLRRADVAVVDLQPDPTGVVETPEPVGALTGITRQQILDRRAMLIPARSRNKRRLGQIGR